MKKDILSLRIRLFTLILLPTVLIASFLGIWRYSVATQTAEDLFDRALLSAALSIARDVAFSEGDALQPSTRALIINAAGGEVFYHVTGPNGEYVTGYASPPISLSQADILENGIEYYHAVYRGEDVRVISIHGENNFEATSGLAAIRVWQRIADRQILARQLAFRALAVLGVMLSGLGLAVWFGVQIGLRPLDDLEQAIKQRSADDLSTIKRRVPEEVRGIVGTLNRLFLQVEKSMNAHQNFISDAAHQLRNPAAATLAMAEALSEAKTEKDRKERLEQLLKAARNSARTTTQLLSLERVSSPYFYAESERFDLNQLVHDQSAEIGAKILQAGIGFEVKLHEGALMIEADRLLIAEGVKNLLQNALVHGGKNMTTIRVTTRLKTGCASLKIWDDGIAISPRLHASIFERFQQAEQSEGSGLGLAIAKAATKRAGGTLHAREVKQGACFEVTIPCV